MVRKPNVMYRHVEGPAYTRKEYMGGIPNLRIQQFEAGNLKGDFKVELALKVKEACQIRHTAMEAARITLNRYLTKSVGAINYHSKFRIYPHQILRENKMATGAGADRISSGMKYAFGKAVGAAARVREGQTVLTLYVNANHVKFGREALRKASMKLPSPCKIEIIKGLELIEK